METLVNLIPFALVALICPLMMWLMMRGMHHGSQHQDHRADRQDKPGTGDRR